MPPCSRCNTFLFHARIQLWARCPTRWVKLGKDWAGKFSKQDFFEEPGQPAERECSAGILGKVIDNEVTLNFVAVCFSVTAFAQSVPPKVGNKPVVRVKPKEP